MTCNLEVTCKILDCQLPHGFQPNIWAILQCKHHLQPEIGWETTSESEVIPVLVVQIYVDALNLGQSRNICTKENTEVCTGLNVSINIWTVYRSILLYESTCVCIYIYKYILLCMYIYRAASLSLSPKYESFRKHFPSPILKKHGFCTSTNQETNSKCGKRPMGVSQSTFFHIHQC